MVSIKPNIIVSQCLEFDHCRYDGQIERDGFIRRLKEHVHFIPVCPEVAIGMGTPRDPIRIVERAGHRTLIQPDTGKDFTEKMIHFAKSYLGKLKNVDGFILKSRSPSCGIKDVKIYAKVDKSAPVKRDTGVFAQEALRLYPDIAVESEARLTNLSIREHFLMRIFALSRLRKLKESGKIKDLVQFQTHNKFILLVYNQDKMRALGKIVAGHGKRGLKEILNEYDVIFKLALARQPNPRAHINVLEHALGYFKKDLIAKEKDFFKKSIKKFEAGKLGVNALITVLRSWMIRFDKKYLLDQTYFEPFPEELLDLTDSSR